MTRLNLARTLAVALSLALVGGSFSSDAQAERSRLTHRKGAHVVGLIELELVVEDGVVFVEGLPSRLLYVDCCDETTIRLHSNSESYKGVIVPELRDGSSEIWEPHAGEDFVDYELTGLSAGSRLQFAAVPVEAEGTGGSTSGKITYGPVITVKPKG